MTAPLRGTARRLKQTISRRLPKRRDDRGLTTLEWLLIVAAVAGLAALAVVLVQNVVSDTAEQIAGNDARKTAATLHAQQITDEARSKTAGGDIEAGELNAEYKQDCRILLITYGDVPELKVVWSQDITAETPPTKDSDVSKADIWNASEKKYGCIVT